MIYNDRLLKSYEQAILREIRRRGHQLTKKNLITAKKMARDIYRADYLLYVNSNRNKRDRLET